MKYAIKRGNTVIVEVHAEGQVTERIMGEQLVDATFSLPTKVQFQLWDSILVDGRTHYLHATPTEEKISSRNFRYTLQFAGVKYFLANILCLFPDKNNALALSEFSITGTATKMLQLIIQNANREQSGWSLGTVATSETKQVDFSGHSCLSALAKVAEAFDLEYWVDANKTISLEERKQASGYTFQYGIHKGLKGITRLPVEGANIVTRVYAEGSEKNLPADYRNYKKKLQMPVPYLEKNTDKYGVIEAVQGFDDIYPHRKGTVTAVNADNPLQFTDINMPFDLNAVDDKGNTTILINKVSAKVTFNTGQLAGYTFEIKEHGYKHETKAFELLVNKDEKDLEVPSEVLRPAVGDAYVITDIVMPQSYITTAEAELQAKAQEYLDKNSEQRNVYEVVADPIYFAEQNVNIVVGHTCLFNDVDFGLNAHLRVLGTVKNLQNLKEVQFELGETATVIHIVRAYFKAEKNTTSLRQYLKYNAEMAKRSYSFAREIADNVFDNEGYFDAKKIKPLSIDTKLLTVGSRSQQFNLVDVLLTVEQNNTAVRNTAGQIIHLTIEDRPRTWNIPANIQTSIGIGFHYIYVKAQRVGTNANILVSNDRIMLEQDTVYYHFEVGYLGSVQNGFRRIKTNYGFTQVSPGEIVTGRMSSANGQHYIDLLQDRINIKGNVTFTADSPALAQTKAISEIAKQQAIYTSSLDATNKVNVAEAEIKAANLKVLEAKALVLEEQAKAYADGKITTAEQNAINVAQAKANLAETRAKAHADGKITAEEAKRIAADEQKLTQAEVKAKELDDAIKQSVNSYTLFAKDKHFPLSSRNEYITDLDAQGGVALRAWRGWSSYLHYKNLLNFLKIGCKYRIYIRAKFKGSIGSEGVKFGWYGGKSGVYELTNKLSTSYKTIDVGVFVVNWAVNSNPYIWFLNTNSFTPNDGSNGSGLYIDWLRFVEADVEDITGEKIAEATAASKAAWETYANLKSSNAQQSAIDAAKAYALAKDNEKETLIKAYADGKITTAERNAINVATAKANLAEARAKVHADGKVTEEEAARIAADQQKLVQAEAKAKELVDAVEVGGRNLAINTHAEGHRQKGGFFQIQLSEILEKGQRYTVAFNAEIIKDTGFLTVLAYYDAQTGAGVSGSFRAHLDTVGNRRYSVTIKITNSSKHILLYPQKDYASTSSMEAGEALFSKIAVFKGDKDLGALRSEEEFAAERDEKIAEATAASKAAWETYASLKSSSAQQSAIDAAKAYALAKDVEKETLIKAYADGKITAAEQNAINVAQSKANLAETRAKAYADGKITTEEAKRIAADQQKLAEAEAKARELVDDIKIGSRNLILNRQDFELKNDGAVSNSDVYTYLNNNGTIWRAKRNSEVGRSYAYISIPFSRITQKLENSTYVFGFYYKSDGAGGLVRISGRGGSGAEKEFYLSEIKNTKGIWNRGEIVFDIAQNSSSLFVLIESPAYRGSSLSIRNIMVVKGTRISDDIDAPEDLAAERDEKIAAAKAALEAQDTAMKNQIATDLGYSSFSDFQSKASQGKTIVKGGEINTELINAVAVISKYVQTNLLIANSILSTNNGFRVEVNANTGAPFRVYYPTGEVWKEIIYEGGKMKEVWYNTAGNVTSWIDEAGFHLVSFSEAKWVDKKFKSLGTSKTGISKGSFGIYRDSQGVVRYNNSGTTYYEYISASTSGTLSNPNEHHSIYKSKSYATSNKIPDGYYCAVFQSNVVGDAITMQDGELPYNTSSDIIQHDSYGDWHLLPCICINSGKIVESFNFIFQMRNNL